MKDEVTLPSMLTERLDIKVFEELHNRCGKVIQRVRERMLAPLAKKVAPRFPASQVAEMLGLDLKQFDYRIKKGELPAGEMSTGRRRFLSVAEARQASRVVRKKRLNPPASRGAASYGGVDHSLGSAPSPSHADCGDGC